MGRLGSTAARLWALPTTLLGLLAAAAAAALLAAQGRPRWRLVDGVIEVVLPEAAAARRLPFAALALGHVVLAVGPHAMEALRDHERAHVRQAERWGPLFVPAYLLESGWQWLRGRRAYLDNRFEVQARVEEASRR